MQFKVIIIIWNIAFILHGFIIICHNIHASFLKQKNKSLLYILIKKFFLTHGSLFVFTCFTWRLSQSSTRGVHLTSLFNLVLKKGWGRMSWSRRRAVPHPVLGSLGLTCTGSWSLPAPAAWARRRPTHAVIAWLRRVQTWTTLGN